MCRIVQDVGILRFYFSEQKYFGTLNFCRMTQDVPLIDNNIDDAGFLKHFCKSSRTTYISLITLFLSK
jgi:hypothetical protein